jgi:isoleucyl-tRNA synthetase
LVNKQGKFTDDVNDPVFGFAGEFVKEEYLNKEEKEVERKKQEQRLKGIVSRVDKYISVDERIALKLKLENKAFKVEKYEHNYPHCWRTDKPILYYPLDSWFIKTTDLKDRMIELNKTINRHRAFRKLAGKHGGLEPFPLTLLGHTYSYLDYRR